MANRLDYDAAAVNTLLGIVNDNRGAFPLDEELSATSEKAVKNKTLYTEISALKSATVKNKGYFKTLDDLQLAHPTGDVGEIAYVGTAAPYAIYLWGDNGWEDTGETHTPEIDFNGFPTKAEMAVLVANAESATTNANEATEKATQAKTAAETATANAISATNAAQQATEETETATTEAKEATTAAETVAERILTLIGQLVPTALTVEDVPRLTKGNVQPVYINATLAPEQVMKNIIYISDNKSVTVSPDGRLTIVGTGRSTVQVIPTINTALAKVIQVEVGEPTLRMTTKASMRFTSSGGMRLN